MITEKESKHVIQDSTHDDGSRTIVFRSDTKYSTKVRIAKRFKGSTLYSDNRLEIPAITTSEHVPKGIQDMEKGK